MNRYTKQEDQLIIEKISKYPSNLDFACSEAANELGRSRGGVLYRYHTVLKKSKPIHSLATNQGFKVNVKNTQMKIDDSQDLKR